MTLRFADIISPSYVDGPGRRVALFIQGCNIRCPGCQNRHLWPADDGHLANSSVLARILIETDLPVTISGGEPFDQAAGLYTLLWHIRDLDPYRQVIIYSGYTFEQLVRTGRYEILGTLALADVLVDGPYIQGQDHPRLQYRGSSNQRVIDLPTTLDRPVGEMLTRGPVLLDWDDPELIVTETGTVLGTSPLIAQFSPLGAAGPTRRCGQARPS